MRYHKRYSNTTCNNKHLDRFAIINAIKFKMPTA